MRVIKEYSDGSVMTAQGHVPPSNVDVITKYVHKEHGDEIFHRGSTPRIRCVFTIRKFESGYFAYYVAFNSNGREILSGNMLHSRDIMGLDELKALIDKCCTLPDVAKEFAGLENYVAPKY